jgi:hypothetical protein
MLFNLLIIFVLLLVAWLYLSRCDSVRRLPSPAGAVPVLGHVGEIADQDKIPLVMQKWAEEVGSNYEVRQMNSFFPPSFVFAVSAAGFGSLGQLIHDLDFQDRFGLKL